MKRTLLTLAVATLFGAPALAVSAEPTQMTADQVVAYTQYMYPGQVVAVRYDRSEAEHPHYHVDMLFTGGRLVKLDVDAVNGRFATVPQPNEQPRPQMTLAAAIEHVQKRFEGEVVAVEFDGTSPRDPHYHADVKLASGHVIPVRVEQNGILMWREAIARQ